MSGENQNQNDQGDQDNKPAPGSDEYNEMMANAYRNQGQDAQDQNDPDPIPKPAMPEGGREKFYNAETGEYNWQAHAIEAEYNAKRGEAKDDKAADDGQKQQADPGQQTEIAKQTAEAGLNIEDVKKSVIETGDITAEQRQAYKDKFNVDDAFIDDYIEGVVAKAAIGEQRVRDQVEFFGGESQWDKVSEWAAGNLSDAKKEYFNKAFNSGDWKEAAAEMKSAFESAVGKQPGTTIQGDNVQAGSATGYKNRAEMHKAISSPEYWTDPEYRAKVAAKVAVSQFDPADTAL